MIGLPYVNALMMLGRSTLSAPARNELCTNALHMQCHPISRPFLHRTFSKLNQEPPLQYTTGTQHLIKALPKVPPHSRHTRVLYPLLSTIQHPIKHLQCLLSRTPEYNLTKKANQLGCSYTDSLEQLTPKQQKKVFTLLRYSGIDASNLRKIMDDLTNKIDSSFKIVSLIEPKSDQPIAAALFNDSDRIIYALAVETDHRKQGLGGFIFSAAVHEIKMSSHKKEKKTSRPIASYQKNNNIRFSTDSSRTEAIEMYKKAGAEPAYTSNDPFDLSDDTLFEKMMLQELMDHTQSYNRNAYETIDFELNPYRSECFHFIDKHLSNNT